MGRNLNNKCKQCRREGQKLFLKGERCSSPKCAMVKRNFPPGMHGNKGYGRLTDYGVQLREKQKAKKIYNLLEKQFYNYFNKANISKSNTEEALLQFLEMRYDNVVFRAGFANSRAMARQAITHNKFLINGKKVNIPSYQVKIGDIISLKETDQKSKQFTNLKDKLKKTEPVSWLSINSDNFEIKVTEIPKLEEIKGEFDAKLIIEFYSR